MTDRQPEFFPSRINQYVPQCSYVAGVEKGSSTLFGLGTPAVADADGVVTAAQDLAADVATSLTSFSGAAIATGNVLDATYGRALSATASLAVGVGTTVVVTIKGRDYLGQPMTETISIAHADGTTAQNGLKAFKYIDSVASDGGGSVDTTILVGTRDVLGLPVKTTNILAELVDNAAATVGTLVQADLTSPATATTGDTRGTYDPNVTLDGTKKVEVVLVANNFINSSDKGGYYGVPHYFA